MNWTALLMAIGSVIGIFVLIWVYGMWIKFCADTINNEVVCLALAMMPVVIFVVMTFYLMFSA